MKRLLLCLFIILTFTVTYADYIYPVRTMMINYAVTPMVMDGVDDEAAWSAEQSTDAFNKTGCPDYPSADFTVSFKVAYDINYLYFFSTILDDYENDADWGYDSPWTYDNVEVFLDLDTNGSGTNTVYDTNTIELRFNRGEDSVSEPGRAKRSDYKYYWENTADGWIIETAIPWKAVLGPGQINDDIMNYINNCMASGFDVSGADSDTDGVDHRDCQTAWDNDDPADAGDRTEDNAWNNKSVLGVINFEVIGCHDEINNIRDFNVIELYPNPITGIVYFENLQGKNKLELLNITGQLVLTADIENNQIDLSQLAKGVYIARIGQDIVKIIKQ
jgi:hypothetical protein